MDLTLFLSVVLFIVIALLLGLLVYSGLLTNISVEARKSPYGELLVYYKSHIGPYSNVGDLFRETQQLAPSSQLVGIYLDDPKYTLADNCRSAIGAIVANPGAESATVSRLESAGYVCKTLPKADNVIYCTFPIINKVSIYISVWRVYPAMRDYLADNGLTARPFIEIYEGSRIAFLAPLSRYDEFQPDIEAPAAPVEAELPEPPAAAAPQPPQEEVEPAEASTEELISEAVAEPTESAAPPSSAAVGAQPSGGEVETVFENQQDLLEAMADRPDEGAGPAKEQSDNVGDEAGEGMDLTDEEEAGEELNANADNSEAAAAAETGEGDEALEAFEQRLAQLEEDLTDKQSRVRSDVSQFNNSLALAEIEEHLRRTAPEQEESAPESEPRPAPEQSAEGSAPGVTESQEPQEAAGGATTEFLVRFPPDQQVDNSNQDSAAPPAQDLISAAPDSSNVLEDELQISHEDAGRDDEAEPTPDSVPLIVLQPAEPLAQEDETPPTADMAAAEKADETDGPGDRPDADPAQVDPAQVDPAQVDPAQVDPAQVDPVQMDPAQVDQAQVDPAQVDLAQVDPAQVDPAQVDPAQVDQAQVDPAQVDPAQVDQAQVGPAQVDQAQVDPAQVDQAQVDQAQVDPAQVDQAQVDPAQVDPAQVDQFVQSVVQRAQQICEEADAAAGGGGSGGDPAEPGTERREKRLPSPLRHQTSRSSLGEPEAEA